MQDCEVTISVRGGKVEMKGDGLSVGEFAGLAGYMQITAGLEAYHYGMPLEDIKTAMLELYQDAMRDVERLIRKGNQKER